MGITEPATETAIPGNCNYIPHHPVTRERKSPTRLKIIFDTSAKSEVPSLDECLHKLSQLNRRVFDILVRFRTFRSITLTYNIEKAFLQIGINKSDRVSFTILVSCGLMMFFQILQR